MAGLLDGKVTLVTGASSGIGRASAFAFAREGSKVVIANDINIAGGEETVRLIKEQGGEAAFFKADVSKPDEVEALFAKVIELHGRLDCAHNNAGTSGGGPGCSIFNLTTAIWDRVISVNLTGVWLCMKHEIVQMLKQGGGSIVNTASVWGLRGTAGWGFSPYVASKHGVVGLTRLAAFEYAKKGIRVNAVCPGPIRTPPIERILALDPAHEADMVARVPLGRLGVPADIAEAVVWLCTNAASYISGHTLVIDGAELAADRSLEKVK